MVVHPALPDAPTAAVDEELRTGAAEHVAHGSGSAMRAADAAAGDARSIALIGPHGQQLDRQLRLAALPRGGDAAEADIILCGLAGEPEVEQATALAPLPIIAFDRPLSRRGR